MNKIEKNTGGFSNKCWNLLERLLKSIIYKILHLLHIDLTEEQWNEFMQFVKFGLVGVSNTVISYVVYAILVYVGFHYLVASLLSFVVSVLNSYYWNSKYVFILEDGEERSRLQTLIKTFMAYAFTGLLLNNILLVFWVQVLHISEYIGPLINLLVSIPINYLINKFWAFRKK